MNHPWPSGGNLVLVPPGGWPQWEPKHILEKYHGPQIVIHPKDGVDYLGIAVDEDESGETVRWIFAPLSSDLEFRALIHGGETLRSAVLKERVYLVDYSARDLRPLQTVELYGSQIPEDALPRPGALLPLSLRERFPRHAPADERPYFDLQSAVGRGIPFGDLAAIAGSTQFIWQAIGQSVNVPQYNLVAVAGGAGSLRVYVDADSEQFGRIATVYRDIMLAFDDPTVLAGMMVEYSRVPMGVFARHLQAIRRHRVDVLAHWPDEAAFAGSTTAERAVGRVLPEALPIARRMVAGTPTAILESPETSTLKMHGYFENFWRRIRSGDFEFYDLDTAHVYAGKVSPTLITETPPDEFALAIGRGTLQRYAVTIEVRYPKLTGRKPGKEKHILKEYTPVP